MPKAFQIGDLICLRVGRQVGSFDNLVFTTVDGRGSHKFPLETVYLVVDCWTQSYVFLADSVMIVVGAHWVDSAMRKV
jgi:hypothetical protein